MAMAVYLCSCDSLESRCCVDTSAVVAGWVCPAWGDRTRLGVITTDAGTNCIDDGSMGDADPDVVWVAVGVTMLALGGAGLTITVRSSVNMSIVMVWANGSFDL